MILRKSQPEGADCLMSLRHLLACVVCASILVAVPSAVAQLPQASPPSTPLTMQEAVEIAKQQNPTLLASRQNLYSVKALETQASVRTNPFIGVAASNVTLPAQGAPNPYAYAVQLSRLFERGQKRRWRIDNAQATTAQTDAQYHDQERSIVLNVRQAFTSLVLAKAARKLADENLKDYRHELDISNDRYKAGDIAKLDYERLDLQLAQFESDEFSALQNLAQAADQLQTLLGYEKPRPDFDVIGDIAPPAIAQALPDLEQKALNSRPDYQAAKAAIRAADANVRLAYANGTSDPTLEGEYDRSGTFNSAGFNINLPIRIFDRNQGNKASSEFSAASSRLSELAMRNQVNSDIDQAWVTYINSKGLSDRYNDHYLAEAKDVLDIAQFSYQHGGLALVDYLDALREYRTTTSNSLTAFAATWVAIHQISFAAATDVTP